MDNDTTQQLNQWKKKYYKTIAELKEREQLDILLRRGLGRLALVAQGLDSTLDHHLSALRTSLRKGLNSKKELEHLLEKIEETIIMMESNKNKPPTTGETLATLLSSLHLVNPYKKQAQQLSKQFKPATNAKIKLLLPQINDLLSTCFSKEAKDQTAHFNFNLFNNKRRYKEQDSPPEMDISLTGELGADQLLPIQTQAERPPMHLLLTQLLERLSLPPALTKRTTAIRRKIEDGVEEQALLFVIDEIADIIIALGSLALAEKREYETFLKSLSDRLNELDEQIHIGTDEEIKAFQERNYIGQTVEEEVKSIIVQVESANDLVQLKLTVNQKVHFLNEKFDSYRQSDLTQYEQSQNQIQKLKQRLHLMEQESIELRQSAMRSRDQALKDPLTGIWNRQALNEVLDKEYSRWQRYKKPLSIILWDIDFFKKVNDQYGHAAGDKVLKTLAQVFSSQTREADFVARYGGEEFMGIFPETYLDKALGLADKIREKIAQSKFHYEGIAVSISTSAGLATFQHDDTIADVFKRADQALYKAKKAGRNRCLTG